ncbi:MAG: hypothetical protein IV105_20345 [Rhizobacter sp.]|nr:hypothetical protein [Rhizobacter sp.]
MEQTTQALQSAMQPLLKLTQANMALLTQFTSSPEVMAQSMAAAQNMMQQGQNSATGLAQSNAFAQLTQGILKNYTEFVTELSQSGMAALAQGQAEMVRRAQEAGGNVIDAAAVRGKRSR